MPSWLDVRQAVEKYYACEMASQQIKEESGNVLYPRRES